MIKPKVSGWSNVEIQARQMQIIGKIDEEANFMSEKLWSDLLDSADITDENAKDDMQNKQDTKGMKWPDDSDLENLPKFTTLNSEQSETVVVDEIFGACNDDEVRFTEGRSIQDFIAEIHDSDKNTDVIQEVSNPEVVHKEDASIPPEEFAHYLNHTAWSQLLADCN